MGIREIMTWLLEGTLGFVVQSNQIQPEIPLVCSQYGQVAEVDHMEGQDMIKLENNDAGKHHYIVLSWVTSVIGGKVKINRPSEEAMQE